MSRVVCHQSPSGWCPNSAPCTRSCGGGPVFVSQSTDRKKPLNCPKGYGLCWTCDTWCDMPSAPTSTRSKT